MDDLKQPRMGCSTRYTFLMLTLLWLHGCAAPMKLQPLPKDFPQRWSSQAKVKATSLPITCSLLDLVGDPRLEKLVQEALDHNHSLRATALRLQASGYLLSGTGSRLWPSVGAGFSGERNNQGFHPHSGKRRTQNHYRASVDISWEIDLWGRLADEHASARMDWKARGHDYLHARDALAARIIQAWLNGIATRQTIRIEQQRLDALLQIEHTLVRRYRQGLGTLDELSTAKTRTEVARADLSQRQDAHLRALRVLEVLLGRYPRGTVLTADELPVVSPPPVSVPAAVLKNRPDVRAALNRIGSAEKSAAAARKALLPNIRLSAQLFKEKETLAKLMGATTGWGILGSLTQPIFEGGRLRDESKARLLEADAALADFYAVMVQALKEAEDAFGRDQDLSRQQISLAIAATEAEKSRHFFEQRYRDGLDSLVNLLIAREQEMNIKLRLVEVQAAHLSNRVDLALALGINVKQKETHPERSSR